MDKQRAVQTASRLGERVVEKFRNEPDVFGRAFLGAAARMAIRDARRHGVRRGVRDVVIFGLGLGVTSAVWRSLENDRKRRTGDIKQKIFGDADPAKIVSDALMSHLRTTGGPERASVPDPTTPPPHLVDRIPEHLLRRTRERGAAAATPPTDG